MYSKSLDNTWNTINSINVTKKIGPCKNLNLMVLIIIIKNNKNDHIFSDEIIKLIPFKYFMEANKLINYNDIYDNYLTHLRINLKKCI